MSDYDHNLPILRQMLALSLINKLDECEFQLQDNPRQAFGLSRPELAERVYVRHITEDGRMKVKVFTTVIGGDNDVPLEVRKGGKDAIRVCATYTTREGKEKGLVKETRVNRIGDIEDIVGRMYERMRNAWRSAASSEKCRDCGAPTFISKKGSMVCAEICWLSKEEKARHAAEFASKRKYRGRRNRYRW